MSKEKTNKKQAKNTVKKPAGVIATIKAIITASGERGATKNEILEILTNNFPHREPKSLANTVSVQVPSRLSKEWELVIRVGNRYMLAKYYKEPDNLIDPSEFFKNKK